MTTQNTKICAKCTTEKKLTDFYTSFSPLDLHGKTKLCKKCIQEMVNLDDVETVKNMLRSLDKPFVSHLWESALTKNAPVGEYFKLINAKDYRHLTWADSIETLPKQESEIPNISVKQDNSNAIIEELKEIYGYGYPDNEYLLFEKKFQQLKPSFQLITTMHEECLREYCVNKVKETLAKARGDFKEAKDWASMAKDVAEAGKLKPSQMSKADLSQGLDGFGQLARMVEEKVDIIPVLPKFIQQPKDKPDVVLWCYLNYVRDLKGLPEADYKDIYNFYEERRADYERQELDNDPSMRDEQ
jgi:hypothetical protein